jgi:hypothetical protein
MKAFAMLVSILLIIYVVALLALTWHNISRTLFGHTYENEPGVRFWMRQIMIILWPLVIASEQGRHALRVIWTGNNDLVPPGREDLK